MQTDSRTNVVPLKRSWRIYLVLARGNPPRDARTIVHNADFDPTTEAARPTLLFILAALIRSAGPEWHFVAAHDSDGNTLASPATVGATALSLAIAAGASPDIVLQNAQTAYEDALAE